jgi:hypothetical protein
MAMLGLIHFEILAKQSDVIKVSEMGPGDAEDKTY